MVAFTQTVLAAAALFIGATQATNFHVNRGCIYINGAYTCAPNSQDIGGGSATVKARLDSTPCTKTFNWPDAYGDVYYGADNCLYDSNGQNIGGQCCV